MKKLTLFFTLFLVSGVLLTSLTAHAQSTASSGDSNSTQQGTQEQTVGAQNTQEQDINDQSTDQQSQQDFFKARIMLISNIGQQVGDDGITSYLQNYTLRAIDGKWQGRDIIVTNSEFNTIGLDAFKPGDVLLIGHSINEDGSDNFYVVDYVRESAMYILAFLFIGMVILMGRMKGLKALIALAVSFMIIIWYILPQIVHGGDPVTISVIGAIIITVLSLYITYGFKYFTHIGAVSIGISLFITVIITEIFTYWTKLTGNIDEQASTIIQLLGTNFNLKGLLLASFIIGAIGVLGDVVINQISLIEELYRADQKLGWRQLFQRGLKVGVDHISAIVNTLFMAYVGASLPLLVIFAGDQSTKYDYSTIINIEVVATEIVRTLTGSLGLVMAVPISTFIAALFIPKYFKRHQELLKQKSFSSHIH